MDVSVALTDPDLGFTAFSVLRTTYRRQNGSSVPSNRILPASGCIHPGTPEMLQLLPEEERAEEFIVIYTDFPLSTGENDGGATYTAPDRILWSPTSRPLWGAESSGLCVGTGGASAPEGAVPFGEGGALAPEGAVPFGEGGALAPEGVNTWRVVRVRSWAMFGYVQALAVRVRD